MTAVWQSNTTPAAVRAALQRAEWQKSLDDWHVADFDYGNPRLTVEDFCP